jgi:outer membrane lipoprotein-sorting protein
MRHGCCIVFILVALAAFFPTIALPGSEPVSSADILNHVDDLFRGSSSRATMVMKVVTSHYTREMRLVAWSKGKDYSLVRILEPLKEKDTSTLKAGNNIWNYLPKVKRVIKIPSSMMGGSWMGSHFTNDDLVKESRMADDYTHSITFAGTRDNNEVIDLTLIPKPDAAVVWGKVVARVRKSDWTPLKIDYYGEKLELERSMSFSDIRTLGGRVLPATMRITPADKPGEYTLVTYDDIEFDIELTDSVFTLRRLQNPETL